MIWRKAIASLLLSALVSTTPLQSQIPAPDTARPAKPADVTSGEPVKADSLHAQRKAAKLYLQGVKLLEKHKAEAAWNVLKQAVELEPQNDTYVRAAELARQSAVTQLVQQASQPQNQSKDPAVAGEKDSESRQLLLHALEIDPKNPYALQHFSPTGIENAEMPVGATASSVIGQPDLEFRGAIQLEPDAHKHSFHLHSGARQVVQEVFRAYGIEASIHESVQSRQVRLDTEDASFADAVKLLGLISHTFYEPLDPHRVVVAQDTRENRLQFQRLDMETIYLPGLTDKQLTDVSNLAKNIFDAQQAVVEPTRGTLTIRTSPKTMDAFNKTIVQLEDGTNQVDLEVTVIQLAHVNTRETGTTFFQQTTVANAYSEIQSILNQNQSAVQQIIASGLVPNSTGLTNQLKIIAILLAAGQVTGSSILTGGFALFGGGITESALGPGPATLNFSLNSSDTRTLEDIHLRLGDDEAGTFKIGERYPIETSSYSAVAQTAISALTGSNSNSGLTVPQIQYEDLGLTLKATPKVMRSEDVALTLEIKIESLGGTSLNNIPILDSQQFSGVLTLKAGETAVLLSDLSKQESRALNGLPGVSDIPGLQDISDIARNQNIARLMIIITPVVVRGGVQQLAHGPRLQIDKPVNSH